MTVHPFPKDSNRPLKKECTGSRREKWPVVAPGDKSATRGIRGKGRPAFPRPDGIARQAIAPRPLRVPTAGTAPGGTNSQGAGGTWLTVPPQGTLVTAVRRQARRPAPGP
ncbi:hypothetical protein BB341_01765 [Streptomyces clavuligerus]|nr:hypothetical protein BB341_01765 [Streptomyces clavuligerus]AXU11580.1 hypothetical protein D1794_01860 [Streptomyces clavuligerus]